MALLSDCILNSHTFYQLRCYHFSLGYHHLCLHYCSSLLISFPSSCHAPCAPMCCSHISQGRLCMWVPLSLNLHIVKFTLFSVQYYEFWHAYRYIIKIQNHSITPQKSLVLPFVVGPFLSPLICFCLYNFTFSRMSSKWNHSVCSL